MDDRDASRGDFAESAGSASVDGPSPSSGRRLLTLSVVGAVAVAVLVAVVALVTRDEGGTVDTLSTPASVSDAGAAATTTTSSSAMSISGFQPPPGYPDWQNGVELATVTLPSGEVRRFVETADGRNLCLVREERGGIGSSCTGLIPPGQYSQSPQLLPSGDATTGWHYTIVLPRGFPSQFTLLDETGATVPFARSSDGRYAVTTQPDRSAAGPSARKFDLVGVDGQRLAQVSLASLPGASADPRSGSELLKVTLPTGDFVQIFETPDHQTACVLIRNSSSCLAFATFPEVRTARLLPSGAPGAGSLYYPFIVPNDFPSAFTVRDTTSVILPHGRSSNGRLLVIVDPTAPPPQIPPTNTGPPSVSPVRTFDLVGPNGQVIVTISTATQPSEPSAPHIALAACVRAQGLDVADPPSAANPTLVPARPYPPDAAYAAWTACRDNFYAAIPQVSSSAIPVSPAVARAFIDCMARQGWLMSLAAGPPTDAAAHADAARQCN